MSGLKAENESKGKAGDRGRVKQGWEARRQKEGKLQRMEACEVGSEGNGGPTFTALTNKGNRLDGEVGPTCRASWP